jgi:hypothetical protein
MINGVPVADATRACLLDPDDVRVAFYQMWTDERLHRLMHADPLVDLIAGLLGEEIFVHPWKVLRMMFPEEPGTIREAAGWHQDFPETQGSTRQLTVWTPLVPCDPETGALAIIPESHRQGLRPLRLANNPSGWEAVIDGDEPVHCGGLRAGDVLLFTTYTVHCGTDNWGRTHRVSVDCRYQPLADPICESSLQLAGLRIDWSDIYANWASDGLKFYWRPLELNTVPFDPRWELWREATALARGVDGDPDAQSALEIAAATGSTAEVREAAAIVLAQLQGLPQIA